MVPARLKKFFKYTAGTAAVLFMAAVVLLWGVVLYLQSPAGLAFAQQRINAAIPGRIEIEHWHWRLLKGAFALQNVRLYTPEDQVVAAFQQLEVGLDWWPLLQRTVAIRHIILTDPQISLIQAPDGSLSIARAFADVPQVREPAAPRAAPESPPSLPLTLDLQRLHVQNAHLHYQNDSQQVDVELSGVELFTALFLGPPVGDVEPVQITTAVDSSPASGTPFSAFRANAQAQLQIARGLIQAPGLQIPLEHFNLEATLQDQTLEALQLELTTAFADVRVTGAIHNFLQAPHLDLQAALQANLAGAQPHLPPDLPRLAGELDLTLDLQGAVADPRARLVLTHHGVLMDELPLDGLELTLVLAERKLDLSSLIHTRPMAKTGSGRTDELAADRITLAAQADLQSAFPFGLLHDAPPDWSDIHYAASLEVRLADLRQLANWLKLGPALEGAVQADLRLHGRGIDVHNPEAQVQLSLTGENFRVHETVEAVALELALQAEAAAGQVDVSTLTFNTAGLTLEADAQYDIAANHIQARVALAAADLDRSLAPLGITAAGGGVALDAGVQGVLPRPDVRLQIKGQQLRWADVRIGNLTLVALLDAAGQLRIDELVLVNQDTRITGAGALQLLQPDTLHLHDDLPLDFALTVKALELKHFVDHDLAEGRLQGKLAVRQHGGRLEADVDLHTQALRVANWPLGDLQLRAALAEGVVHVKHLVLQNKASHIEGQGHIALLEAEGRQLLEHPQMTFTLKSDGTHIEDFYADMRGRLTFTADVHGPLRAPGATLQLALHDLDTGYQHIPETQLRAVFDGQTVELQELLIELAPGQQIVADGWYALDQTYALALHTTAIDLNSIEQIAQQQMATGTLQIRATGTGSLTDPRLDAQITFSDLLIQQQSLDDVTFRLNLADQQVHLQGDQPIALQARYHLTQQDFDLQVVFDNWQAAPVFDLLQQPDFSGSLNGQVTARGNLATWQDLTAELDINQLELQFKDTTLLASKGLRAQMQNQQVTIVPSLLTILSTGHLEIGGEMALEGPLAISLDAILPLAVAEGFSNEILNFKGNLMMQAQLNGTLADPRLEATATLEDAGMLLAATGQLVQNVNALITLTPEALNIARMEGGLDDGRFGLSGRVALSAWQPTEADVRLTASALPIVVPDVLDLQLNIDIALQGTPDNSRLSGDILILEGLYYQDVNLYPIGDLLSRRRETTPVSPELPQQPFLHNLTLDLDIKRRNPLLVDNNVASLDINPDLNIGGRLSQPVISGRAEVVSGEVYFQKKTFTVSRGVVDFVDPYRIDPVVDIHSRMRVRHYDVNLVLSGPVSQLRFQLSSTPHEEDGDIISLLLFGKTTRELVNGEGGSTQSAGMMLAELVASTFGDDLRDATGLDILTLETTESDSPDTSERVQVTMGKELSRRMTVKYAVAARKGGTVQRIITEYRFFENILLSGFQDNHGAFGGEVQFRMEFR